LLVVPKVADLMPMVAEEEPVVIELLVVTNSHQVVVIQLP
tara:strand:- start:484 stop:603 length:120 start_codon:yes stop_codon:yes gene_type:complete